MKKVLKVKEVQPTNIYIGNNNLKKSKEDNHFNEVLKKEIDKIKVKKKI